MRKCEKRQKSQDFLYVLLHSIDYYVRWAMDCKVFFSAFFTCNKYKIYIWGCLKIKTCIFNIINDWVVPKDLSDFWMILVLNWTFLYVFSYTKSKEANVYISVIIFLCVLSWYLHEYLAWMSLSSYRKYSEMSEPLNACLLSRKTSLSLSFSFHLSFSLYTKH